MTYPHILLLAERYPPDIGGLARSGARIAASLAELGADVDVLAYSRALAPGALVSEEPSVGGKTGPAPGRLQLHRLGLFANLDLSQQHTVNVVEWMHGQRPFDLVWGHYLFPTGFAAVVLGKMLRIASTVSARGNDVDRMMFPPGDFARLLWTLEHADAVTAVSHALARKIDVLLGAESAALVVPNVVDLELFQSGPPDAELRRQLGIADDEVVLGFCGELRHKKGFPFMLDALAQVRQQHSACLLIIGEVRPREQAHLQAFATEQPEAAGRIVVTERIDDPARVAAHYRLCDVFLHPSVWDGLPNALLEAMACERVVLVSDAGGIPEVVENKRSGLVLPRAELHKLGIAVLEVLGLPRAEREKLGAAARERVERRFHPRHELEALSVLLRRLNPSWAP